MSEDAAGAQDAGTAPETAQQTQQDGNPLFRTTETVKGRTGAQNGAQGDDKDAAAVLADATADGQDEDPLAKAQAEIARWKQQARENERRAKANADKAKQFDAYEESQKTEQQKLADQLAAAQEEARKERGSRLRLLAAAQYDLDPSLIDYLGDGDEDAINERAEAFARAINEKAAVLAAAQVQAAQQAAAAQQQPRANGFGRPVEALRPGALPATDNRTNDPNAWIRQALGRK
jgi:hypothetical protein